jgi:serine/threonine protein kinase
MEIKKRKQKKFFDKNGGEILKSMGINIFTEEQLNKITNRYSTPIGEGAFGKVFMGTTDDAQRVAVKRASMKGEMVPQEEFVNEITFQFRISHANMVRLLGCCLETDIPMLVFEFAPKGSLYNVLHGGADHEPHKLSLQQRLDIAIGSAEALAHMHSHGDHNHVHGDIKSGNILLDDDLTPKVSDFGSSKLVSVASMYSKWCVSGDMSYIDPVYIKSGRFTEKSDVYSFGVVLLELITRKTARYGDNSLPLDFVKFCKEEGNGRKLYDSDISCSDAQCQCYMECLSRIGELAVRCLKEDVDERPTMAEIVKQLKQVKVTACCGGSCSEASLST